MAPDLHLVTQLLRQLLSAQSPELGARLKQRLNALLAARGSGHFDERVFGHRKFRDFLEHTQAEWLEISRPSDIGDIQVSLKTGQASLVASQSPATATHAHAALTSVGAPIRSDVWQAFTNPDPQRRRFFHRDKATVKHYVANEQSAARQEIDAAPADFVEIKPIAGTQQQSWMREFLDSIPVTGVERTPYDAIVGQPYSSALNAMFTRALGERAAAWREFRTKRVTDTILGWAANSGLSSDKLRVDAKLPEPVVDAAPPAMDDAMSPRHRAAKLLELLSEDDLSAVVIPVLLSTILVKSRL